MKFLKLLLPMLMLGASAPAFSQHCYTYKNIEICIKVGNIVEAATEAIVNAANEFLASGGGVCGAIFRAAGKGLDAACNLIPADSKGVRCPVGQARITPAFALPQKYIIHAVGPDCRVETNPKMQDILLNRAYVNTLYLAAEHTIASIAFPFISSAIYAFPKERAAKIALEAIHEYIDSCGTTTSLKSIHMVLFSLEDYDIFLKNVTV